MRLLKSVFVVLSLLVVFVLAGGTLLAHLYGDEVKRFVVEEMNKGLAVPIQVESIEFSVLRKFPKASLQFAEVQCPSVGPQFGTDTLFFAEKVFVQFSVLDLLFGDYVIRKVHLENASFHILYDKRGRDNFHFWKPPQPKEKKEGETKATISYELNQVLVEGVELYYYNKKSGIRASLEGNAFQLQGLFSSNSYALEADCDVMVKEFFAKQKYIENSNMTASFSLQVDSNHYEVNQSQIALDQLEFQVTGNVVNTSSSGLDLDVQVDGKKISLPELVAALPENVRAGFQKYNPQGKADIKVHIVGKASEQYLPEINIGYKVSNASAKVDTTELVLKKIDLEGQYKVRWERKGKLVAKQEIDIPSFNANIGSNSFKGSLNVSSFTKPLIELSLTGDFDLKALKKDYLPALSALEYIEGNVAVDATLKGRIKGFDKYTKKDLNNMKISGTMEARGVEVQATKEQHLFTDINGTVVFNDEDAFIEELALEVGSSDMTFDGYFNNFLPFVLLDGERLLVTADFRSKEIDLNELLVVEGASFKKEDEYMLELPEMIDLNLKLAIDHLQFRRFDAANAKGDLRLKGKKVVANQLSFNGMGGGITAAGILDGSTGNDFLLTCDAQVDGIDINQLFYQFENFGQSVIQENNIRGNADATIQFASVWSKALEPDMDKLYTKADITIEKGKLNDFEMLLLLSDYIEIEELKKVSFSTLSNQIVIKNREIHVPKMEIKSSALNVELSGVHGFDNSINYNFKVYLPEILAKKSRKKKSNEEFGRIEDDGLGMWLFLSMTGTVEQPIIKYNRKEAIQKIKEDLKEEKQTIKQILNEEFGWFKKDTTLKAPKKKKFDDDYFIIEWEEDDKKKKGKGKGKKKLEEEEDDDF